MAGWMQEWMDWFYGEQPKTDIDFLLENNHEAFGKKKRTFDTEFDKSFLLNPESDDPRYQTPGGGIFSRDSVEIPRPVPTDNKNSNFPSLDPHSGAKASEAQSVLLFLAHLCVVGFVAYPLAMFFTAVAHWLAPEKYPGALQTAGIMFNGACEGPIVIGNKLWECASSIFGCHSSRAVSTQFDEVQMEEIDSEEVLGL